MISVELVNPNEPDEIEIYLDRKGLADLLAQLRFLDEARTDHVHLMAESWGGSDLNEEPVRSSATPIRHIKIHRLGP